MRILVLPTISKKSLSHESCFLVFWQIARAMPEHYFHFILGKSANTSALRLPNMNFICTEDNVEYNTIHTSWPSEVDQYFHRMYGRWPVDLIFTSRSPLAALLKQKMTNVRSKARIPVCTFITKALGKNDSHDQLFDTDLHLRGLGYSECPTMFLTDYEKKIGLDSMRGHFSATAIQKAEKNAMICCQGMAVDRINGAIKDVVKNDKTTLFYGGRLVGNKHWDDIIKLFWDFRAVSGMDMRIDVVSPGGDTRLGGSSLGSQVLRTVQIDTDLSQEECWKRMAQAHISMSWSEFEGLPIGFIEQIMCGLVFLCVRKPWSVATLGKDYPFFFKTKEEARALLKWACKHLHKAQEMMKEVREDIEWRYGMKTTTAKLNAWWNEIVDGTYFSTLPTNDLTHVLKAMPPTFTLDEFVEGILKYKPGYAQGLCQEYVSTSSAELTRRDVMKWIRKYADDNQEQPVPVFEKH